jgi:hypothetical protein
MSTPLSQARTLPRFAEAAVERARLTLVPRRSTKAPRVPFVSLVTLLLVGGVVGLLLFNTNMQQASFVATSMEEQAAVLAGKEESLRMQLHRLRDPQHVAERARRLGMVPSSSPAFIRLSDGKVLGRPTPAENTDMLPIAPPPPAKPASVQPAQVVAPAPTVAAPALPAARSRGEERRDTARRNGRGSRERGQGSRTKNRSEEHRAPQSRGRTP